MASSDALYIGLGALTYLLVIAIMLLLLLPRRSQTGKPPPAAPPASQITAPGRGFRGVARTTSSYHYDFSTNACALRPDPSGNNTAMSPSLSAKLGYPKPGPGSSICGKKLVVKNVQSGKRVVVTVLDLRGDEYGLDLQSEAFKRIDNGAGVQKGNHANLEVRWE